MTQDFEKYRRFLLDIAYELTSEDLAKLGYILPKEIPAGKIETLLKCRLELFEELERGRHIGPGNLEYLHKLLKAIYREDLANEVEKFDSSRKARLRPKSINYVENSGYRLSISGGKHLVNDESDDFVYLRSGENYELVITNLNNHRARCKVKIDGHVIFPGLIVKAGMGITLDRPCHTAGRFKFFAVKDAPRDSGIDARNTEKNGCIQVTFTPEVDKMKIICDIGDGRFYSVTCSVNTTDVEFHSLISRKFSCQTATILTAFCKPLGKRNVKLVDYGIVDGSRVHINFGLPGGGVYHVASKFGEGKDLQSSHWIPGASTMQGESEDTFVDVFDFVPNDDTRKVVLHLRLIARAEDEIPLPSNGKCTPFVLGNRHPPPVY